VLETTVVTSDGHAYYVAFRSLHDEANPIEYVWLCLMLASKLLYVIGNQRRQQPAKAMLREFIQRIGDTRLAETDTVADLAGPKLRVFLANPPPSGKTIIGRLAYVNPAKRLIWTSIPVVWYENQFPHTFLAVVDAALPALDRFHRDRLQGSLARMAELYAEGRDSSSLAELMKVPRLAFMEAKVVDIDA
jgi:hypothetical protein